MFRNELNYIERKFGTEHFGFRLNYYVVAIAQLTDQIIGTSFVTPSFFLMKNVLTS